MQVLVVQGLSSEGEWEWLDWRTVSRVATFAVGSVRAVHCYRCSCETKVGMVSLCGVALVKVNGLGEVVGLLRGHLHRKSNNIHSLPAHMCTVQRSSKVIGIYRELLSEISISFHSITHWAVKISFQTLGRTKSKPGNTIGAKFEQIRVTYPHFYSM